MSDLPGFYCSAVICNGCGHVYMARPSSCDCGNDESVNGFESAAVFIASEVQAAREQDEGYPPCDTCGCTVDYMPWHYSEGEERHLHACDGCWDRCRD